MISLEEVEPMINHLVKQFSNITFLDIMYDFEDLKSEAYLVLCKQNRRKISGCKEETALWRSIKHHFINLYRKAKRKDEKFISVKEESPQESSEMSMEFLLGVPADLIQAMLMVNNPSKTSLTRFLIRKKQWNRRKALNSVTLFLTSIV